MRAKQRTTRPGATRATAPFCPRMPPHRSSASGCRPVSAHWRALLLLRIRNGSGNDRGAVPRDSRLLSAAQERTIPAELCLLHLLRTSDSADRTTMRVALWSGPRNLKFEEGVAGKAPPGWFVPGLPREADYLVELRRDHCRSRSGCAVVTAHANVPRPAGNLMQSFGAAAYAGKTVRLRAWLRVESFFVSPALGLRLPAPEDRAELWLTVERTNRRKGFSEN